MPALMQLTESGATVPYGICIDSQDCIWIASKGGVFRFDRTGRCLFADKHDHPKQISAFPVIRFVSDKDHKANDRILSKYADDNACFLVLYDMQGTRKATAILDYPVNDIATQGANIFLTCKTNAHTSEILHGHMDDLSTFQTIASSTDIQFQHICCSQEKQLIVSCLHLPIHPYSAQHMRIMDFNGRVISNFSSAGKDDGEIFWPRAIEINKSNMIILDKTGRLQEFSFANNNFIRIISTIPAGLANGFCIDNQRNQLLVTCSGLIYSENDNSRIECNDWIESVPAIA